MKLPLWPAPLRLARITPALYNAALVCPAKALWGQYGDRNAFPSAPSSVLGRAFHAVLEAAVGGRFPYDDEQRRDAAYAEYDRAARDAWNSSHALIRWKYPTPDRLPRYFNLRAEAGEESIRLKGASTCTAASGRQAEWMVSSKDGLIAGRIDYYNPYGKEIVDYKTGENEDGEISDTEARQLRLYAYLAQQNDVQLEHCTIVRGSGTRTELNTDRAEIELEAMKARETLDRLNQRIAAGASIEDLAQPSAENCRFCACRPICEPFWCDIESDWAETTGTCAEGKVLRSTRLSSSSGVGVVLELSVIRGSIASGSYTTESLSCGLVEADGSPSPTVGQTVRIIDTLISPPSTTLRSRRHGFTTIWTK